MVREAAGMAGEDDYGKAPIREPAMIDEVAHDGPRARRAARGWVACRA